MKWFTLILCKQFFSVFDETDEHYYRRPCHAGKEHDFKSVHEEERYWHEAIVA